jgi:hypothetical protein
MALKAKITKAEHAALATELQAQYVDNGDGEFTLDVEGAEDVGALKRALIREKAEKNAAAKERDEQKKIADDLAAKHTPSGEKTVKQTEAEWKAKYDADIAKANATVIKMQDLTRNQVANQIATELFTAPKLGIKYILDRLKVTVDDEGVAKVIVLLEDGTETTTTIADFKKELRANKDLAAIVIGSKASGGGASGGSQNGGGGATTDKKFSEMNDAERTELYRTDPVRFDRESAEAKKIRRVV